MIKKLIIYISCGILLLILIFWIKSCIENKKSRIPYIVTSSTFENVIVSTGELTSESFIKILAPSQELKENGIFEISVANLLPEGSIIDSGSIVATLDQTKILEKLEDIEKSLMNAQNDLQNTQLDTSMELSSSRDLILNNKYVIDELNVAVTQSKYESPAVIKLAENNLEKGKRELNQAIKNYELKIQKSKGIVFQKRLEVDKFQNMKTKMLELKKKLTIISPSHGMLVYYKGLDGKLIQAGSVIQLWRDGIIAILPDFSSMISNTYINEIEISKVKKGQIAKVGVDAFPGKSFLGKVIYIANIGEQLSNYDAKVFNAKIKLDQTDSILRPGMTTSNRIYISSLSNTIFIPIEAVQSSADINYVLLNKGFFTIKRLIELGEFNDNYVVIKKGLKAGDEIFLSATEKGKEGLNLDSYASKDSVKKNNSK